MKRVLTTVASVLSFTGIAALTLFFVETSSATRTAVPAGNLIANIASNNPADFATEGALAQTAAPPDESGAAASGGAASRPLTPAPAQDQSAPPPPPQPSPPAPEAIPSPPPLAPLGDSAVIATSVLATTTITVTTIAPPSPPVPPSGASPAQMPNPIGLTLPYNESNFANDQNWKTTWGTMDVAWSGSMDLAAGQGSTGGAVYLKNAADWGNYEFDAALDWIQGKTFGLMAGYRDASNYVLCKFDRTNPGAATMQLLAYFGGKEAPLTPSVTVIVANESDIHAAATVSGLYGTCSLEGQSITNAEIGPGNAAMSAPAMGSIGFMVSDPIPGTSQILIKQIAVKRAA